jgi:hemerythrin-like domain-containing protein
VKQLLGELEKMDKGDEQWTARSTVLKENVEHHVEEEEGDMFPKARKVLSTEQAEILGTLMEEAKKEELKNAAAG